MSANLSIGNLSEEAQETRKKDFISFCLNHTRKFSRMATNVGPSINYV
jgi:hypothetical protein